MFNTINLTEQERHDLRVSKEARQIIDLLYDGDHMEPCIEIKKNENEYLVSVTIYGDFGESQEGAAYSTNKMEAISLAFEEACGQILYNKLFETMFPECYYKLVKKEWFSHKSLVDSSSVLNEMKRAGLISNIENNYIQNGNDGEGNPLWDCETRFEIKKLIGNNEVLLFKISNFKDKKSAKAYMARAIIWNLYFTYGLDQIM